MNTVRLECEKREGGQHFAANLKHIHRMRAASCNMTVALAVFAVEIRVRQSIVQRN